MRMTSKGRYAVTALLDLLLHQAEGFVSLADVSARQNIPFSYLAHLFADMSKHKLIKSQRGPGGGYCLAKPASEISLADIIFSVEEDIDNRRCGGKRNCQNKEVCLTHTLWEDLNGRIENMLATMYLSDIATKNQVVSVAARQDASIAHHRMESPASL